MKKIKARKWIKWKKNPAYFRFGYYIVFSDMFLMFLKLANNEKGTHPH